MVVLQLKESGEFLGQQTGTVPPSLTHKLYPTVLSQHQTYFQRNFSESNVGTWNTNVVMWTWFLQITKPL